LFRPSANRAGVATSSAGRTSSRLDRNTQVERGTNTAVVATIPLSEMFGYIGQLRSMSSGRASFTMEFSPRGARR